MKAGVLVVKLTAESAADALRVLVRMDCADDDGRRIVAALAQDVAGAIAEYARAERVALEEPELPMPPPPVVQRKRGRKPGGHNRPKVPPPPAVQTEMPAAANGAEGGTK